MRVCVCNSQPYDESYCTQLGYLNAVYEQYAKAQEQCFDNCKDSGVCVCVCECRA